jgi:hypothetical protein
MKDMLETLREAAAKIEALKPEPQFVIVHPNDFPDFKEKLESEGLEADPQPGSNIWNFRLVKGTLSTGVIFKVAVTKDAKQGQTLAMPIPDFSSNSFLRPTIKLD